MRSLSAQKIRRKHRSSPAFGQYGFESIGEILSRLRRERGLLEAGIGTDFDTAHSRQLDAILIQQETFEGLEERG
jgi:hypothetical protein